MHVPRCAAKAKYLVELNVLEKLILVIAPHGQTIDKIMMSPQRALITEDREHSDFRALVEEVWGSDAAQALARPEGSAYFRHYKQVAQRAAPQKGATRLILSSPTQKQSSAFIDLIKLVQDACPGTLGDLTNSIKSANVGWLQNNESDDSLSAAVAAATELWLFTSIDCSDSASSILTLIERSLVPSSDQALYGGEVLPSDFSAKLLSRTCNFSFTWTSDLARHLKLRGPHDLYFFRHAKALDHHIASGSECV